MANQALSLSLIGLTWALAATAAAPPELLVAGARELARPHDLVLGPDGRHLYVADLNHHRVAVLEADSLRLAGVIGAGQLSAPHDVDFTPDGRLLVADTGNQRVAIYRVAGTAGEPAGEWRADLRAPEGVAVAGDTVYVSSVGSGEVVALREGVSLRRAGRVGRGIGEFLRPHDLEVGADGLIYVTDPGNNRLQLLDAQLRVVEVLGAPQFAFREPKYLALDPRGLLYLADQHNNQVKIFDPQRRLVTAIGEFAGGDRLNWPEGVEVVGDRIWVSDTYNDRVLLFRWAGP